MKLSHEIAPMREGDSYWYLASPFSDYPEGHEQAWLDICRVRGALLGRGIYSYSPIAESWGAVSQMKLPTDHVWWRGDNLSKMLPAVGIIVVKLLSWDRSKGVKGEIAWFRENKGHGSIVWLDP